MVHSHEIEEQEKDAFMRSLMQDKIIENWLRYLSCLSCISFITKIYLLVFLSKQKMLAEGVWSCTIVICECIMTNEVGRSTQKVLKKREKEIRVYL